MITEADRKKLLDELRTYDTLMVATRATDGAIHARPMVVADSDETGEVWFVSHLESPKVDEIVSDPTALVTGQKGNSYISMSGEMDVIKDPERLASLWKSSWNVWFEDGPDDARVVLLRLRPRIGEFWVAEKLGSVRYLFDATRALLDGTTPRETHVAHAKVPL